MRNRKVIAGLLALLFIAGGVASAADLNEVAPFLVFPAILTGAAFAGGAATETFVTITNTGAADISAHGSYIDGDTCFECNFNIPLTGADTETLVFTRTATGVSIESLDGTISRNCDFQEGMLVINAEDPAGKPIGANILFGEEVVVNYQSGYAYSIPAVPFQGIAVPPNGPRVFEFDNVMYKGFPRRLAADFLAPHDATVVPALGELHAELVTFTLDFETQSTPSVDCRINGFDAAENNFSNSFLQDCWQADDLCNYDAEFCYPNLGQAGNFDEHGWLSLDCTVNGNDGGVHGAIIQWAGPNAIVRPPAGPPALGWVAWARLLYQSASSGDSVTFTTNPAPAPPGGWN